MQAQGISIAESFGSIVAEVVTVDMSGGEPRVLHVACAVWLAPPMRVWQLILTGLRRKWKVVSFTA